MAPTLVCQVKNCVLRYGSLVLLLVAQLLFSCLRFEWYDSPNFMWPKSLQITDARTLQYKHKRIDRMKKMNKKKNWPNKYHNRIKRNNIKIFNKCLMPLLNGIRIYLLLLLLLLLLMFFFSFGFVSFILFIHYSFWCACFHFIINFYFRFLILSHSLVSTINGFYNSMSNRYLGNSKKKLK